MSPADASHNNLSREQSLLSIQYCLTSSGGGSGIVLLRLRWHSVPFSISQWQRPEVLVASTHVCDHSKNHVKAALATDSSRR